MNNEYTLHIDVSNLQSDTSRAKTALDTAANKAENNDATTSDDSVSFKAIKKSINAAASLAPVKITSDIVKTGTEYGMYRLTTIGSRYGDQARQNSVNNLMTGINVAGSFGVSTLVGAITAGPTGAVIGAVSSLLTTALQAVERLETWQQKQDTNTMNEVRSSDRIGKVASDRNR